MRALAEPFILSVSGRDRPGLLAVLAAALDRAGIEIVDIEQATLQDFLALSFLLDLGKDASRSARLLGDVIPEASALGLAVDVRRVDADRIRLLKETERVVATVVSERPSARLVAEVASTAAAHRANIVSIRRLAEEDLRAGEFTLDVTSVESPTALKADLLALGERLAVDVALAREDVYRTSKRVVVFDMDSTLVAAEVIDVLAERAGKAAEVARLTHEAMEGRMDFEASLRERVALLRGLPESVLAEVAAGLPLTPGAEESVAVLKRLGYRLGVVSGGFSYFVDALRDRLGLDHAFANRLVIRDGAVTGEIEGPVLDAAGKAICLAEIAGREGVPLDQVVGGGDGANDIPMLQSAGLGIAFRAREATRRSADGAIQRNDFSGLLYLLGVTGRDLARVRESG